MTRISTLLATLLALTAPATAIASGAGYATRMGQVESPYGRQVPEVVITLQPGHTSLSREQVQADLRKLLAEVGVSAGLIELQSVATAAIQIAAEQDRGLQTICYERWCARVSLGG